MREIRTSGLLLQLGERGVNAMRMIGDWVGGDTPEFTMANETAKELLRCPDKHPRRCRRWTEGRDELLALGLLERTGNRSEYRAVMPSARTHTVTKRVPSGSQVVPSGSQNVTDTVQLVTDTVQNVTHTVRAYKEVDKEKKTREIYSVRDHSDKVLFILPENRRTSPSSFATEYQRAVQEWARVKGVSEPVAAQQIEDSIVAHVKAHRAAGKSDEFFPGIDKLLNETAWSTPTVHEPSPEMSRREMVRNWTW